MDQTLKIFKALSDGNRLRITASLTQFDELCACQITEFLEVSGATVSRHLALLTDAGILTSRKEGRWVFFTLVKDSEIKPLVDWIKKDLDNAEQIKKDRKKVFKITAVDPEEICRKQRGDICCPRKTKSQKEKCI